MQLLRAMTQTGTVLVLDDCCLQAIILYNNQRPSSFFTTTQPSRTSQSPIMNPDTQDPIQSQQAEQKEGQASLEPSLDINYQGLRTEQWCSLVNLITTTTKTAFSSSPQDPDLSEQAFQIYWRTVFSRLATSVKTDPSIPFYITSPPVKKFTITLFRDRSGMGCPCSLPEVSPNIVVANETGVSKEDVMRVFTEYMYGTTLPTIFYEPEYGSNGELDEDYDYDDPDYEEVREERGCSLVHGVNWMGRGAWIEPNIFMYCYGPDRFAEMLVKEEEEEVAKRRAEEGEGSEEDEEEEVEEVAAMMVESKL